MAARAGKRSLLQREFEDLLLDVLDQDYDLAVRRKHDPLERRRRGIATLCFEYHWASPHEARAVVRVEGANEFQAVLPVDFSSPEEQRRAAENCESLVLFLSEHLAETREKALTEAASGRLRWGRREDD